MARAVDNAGRIELISRPSASAMSGLRRSTREKAARFEEFGCTFCYQITPGKLDLPGAGRN
jgi:hypothetical protein